MELTLRQKIGQLVMCSLDGRDIDENAQILLRDYCVGNIIHFGNNILGMEDSRILNDKLITEIKKHCAGVAPLLCIDHEGGRVMRFARDFTWFPSHLALGAADDDELTEAIGYAMGEELRAAGFNLNFAPVVDVMSNKGNPVIGVRSFGSSTELVSRQGAAMARGMQKAGVMACLKHFPGHGDTGLDSHYFLPNVEKTREELYHTEFAPYRAICPQKVNGAIMTAHILFPALEPKHVPATMSSVILTDILRGEIGFDGIIVSDGIQMKAIADHYGVENGCIAAINAGVDLLCVGTGGSGSQEVQRSCLEALYQAALSGEIPMSRIDEAVGHILAAKQIFCTEEEAPVPYYAAHAQLNERACRKSATRLGACTDVIDGRIVCASAPVRELAYGLTHADPRSQSFAECAGTHLGTVYTTIDKLDACEDYDTLVIGMQKITEDSIEIPAAKAALARGKKVAFVLLGTPYGAELLPADCPVVCVYTQTPQSVATALDVLAGKIQPEGKLPIVP